jgi:hypothetical protein
VGGELRLRRLRCPLPSWNESARIAAASLIIWRSSSQPSLSAP